MVRYWNTRNAVALALFPLSLVYCALMRLRRMVYGWLPARRVPARAVIVVGNLTVGGTGKTPMVIWLCRLLAMHGYRPGVVSRGHGGRRDHARALLVTPESDPAHVGDEPVLIAARTGCPVVVDRRRPRGARLLVTELGCDVVVADDGLQHYALARDVEIVMIDGARRFGNGLCLPAGPLRESADRLGDADFVVATGRAAPGEFPMELVAPVAIKVADPSEAQPLKSFAGKAVHGVAGIGNPERFFTMLEAARIRVDRHAFPDHHPYRAGDIRFPDSLPVLMTEKDAVKCRAIADDRHWFVPVAAAPDEALAPAILSTLQAVSSLHSLR
ncbi:tetraacyldisaccharide 4'-kinase [Thioalkalivibrio denitrificans]|uniref:Tetraacyldisaccharide 4'-kinase n=1 Tax=Thioalkalivibrio denitrificans TaxID=108003 RepID=A0A1V3NHN6_9GAMM|nr:tetraacyldisaccharide 4'-kinase [Thioalkalivibrio denitrificans]